jgi:predicted nucleotidyltransferase
MAARASQTEVGSVGSMMIARISINRDLMSALCERWHIRRLAMFGSVRRDDFSAGSDVDVLVEFEPGHVPGLDFIRIERELSELIGHRVDLLTPKFLSPRIREDVLRSAEYIYGGDVTNS